MEKGHKKLEIYQKSHQLAVRVHEMSLKLPALKRFEEGSQIRRSSKSISSNIVEGFALRRYKAEETIEHLELLFETKSLTDKAIFEELFQEYNFLCGKIMRFIQFVDKEFDTPNFIKEPETKYESGPKYSKPKTRISKQKINHKAIFNEKTHV